MSIFPCCVFAARFLRSDGTGDLPHFRALCVPYRGDNHGLSRLFTVSRNCCSTALSWPRHVVPKLMMNRRSQKRSLAVSAFSVRPILGRWCTRLCEREGCSLVAGSVWCLLGEVVAERLGSGGVAQFGYRFGFDLPDTFSGHPVQVADLIECARAAIGESESQPDDAGLPLG